MLFTPGLLMTAESVKTVMLPDLGSCDREFIGLVCAICEGLLTVGGSATNHIVHCETNTGIVNPIEEIGAAVAQTVATYIVDAMSSFGAIPIDLKAAHVDLAKFRSGGLRQILALPHKGLSETTVLAPTGLRRKDLPRVRKGRMK